MRQIDKPKGKENLYCRYHPELSLYKYTSSMTHNENKTKFLKNNTCKFHVT